MKFFKRFRFRDQSKISVRKFAGQGNKFKHTFRDYLQKSKGLKITYGGFKKLEFKKILAQNNNCKKTNILNSNINLLFALESRLESVLLKSYFCRTIEQAKQFISHGHVKINNRTVKTHSSTRLKHGDMVSIASNKISETLIKKNIEKASFWPVPSNYLLINYKTLNIVYFSKNVITTHFFPLYAADTSLIRNLVKYK